MIVVSCRCCLDLMIATQVRRGSEPSYIQYVLHLTELELGKRKAKPPSPAQSSFVSETRFDRNPHVVVSL